MQLSAQEPAEEAVLVRQRPYASDSRQQAAAAAHSLPLDADLFADDQGECEAQAHHQVPPVRARGERKGEGGYSRRGS